MLHTKLIGRIALALPIAIFSGVNLSAYASQETGSSDRNHGSAPDEPADDNEAIAPAANLWRSLALSYGSTSHYYREPDPLGRVDPLDSHPHNPSHTALARQTGASHSRTSPAIPTIKRR